MLRALRDYGPSFVHLTDRGSTQYLGKKQYMQVLCDSVFVPCCMGNVNLDSYRIYEALECGAVPILEKRGSLDYFRNLLGDHPMPSFTNWREARRFLKEIQFDHAAQDEMLLRCSRWWTVYKENLTLRVQDWVGQSTQSASPVLWPARLPGARFVELLRHHSVPAFARRIQLQVARFRKQQRWRQTTGA